jgi:hypothetical protein
VPGSAAAGGGADVAHVPGPAGQPRQAGLAGPALQAVTRLRSAQRAIDEQPDNQAGVDAETALVIWARKNFPAAWRSVRYHQPARRTCGMVILPNSASASADIPNG